MGLREDVGTDPFLVDTSPLIYFIERHARFHRIVQPLFAAVDRREVECVASVVTLVEVLVVPLRLGRLDLAEAYEDILTRTATVRTRDATPAIAREAARLRASHGLRTPDAIVAATARENGIPVLVTNDSTFRRIPWLRVLVVSDYVTAP